MTPISAAKAKELLDAATDGPWRMQTAACDHDDADEHTAIKGGGHLVAACVEDINDAALMTAAPDLAATVVALEAERDEAQKNYQWMVDHAANQKLDGYRELGEKVARAEAEAKDGEK